MSLPAWQDFVNKSPGWAAPGVNPPDNIHQNGYPVAYKLPADFINWHLTADTKAIDEIQERFQALYENVSDNADGIETLSNSLGEINTQLIRILGV